ncbi:MAG: hypothetical protein PHS93_08030 [Candidatus Omnitrophica bacterium]|nr:hypothetical protein [Candidatus Omnitrophota bacterium]MDD5353091.1 hypothetical protein [Candidatus Omnitrophota bacterium]
MKTKISFIFFLIMLFTIIFTGCPVNPGPEPTAEPTAAPTPTATPEPAPVIPAENPVQFALYDGTNLHYWDGVTKKIVYTGNVKSAAPRVLAIDNVLNYFDEYGSVEYASWLKIVPTAITIQKKQAKLLSREIVYDDDVWMLDHITPEWAYANGGMYRDYCAIYYNDVMIGNWWDNMWNPAEVFVTESENIIARNDYLSFHNINGTENIFKAYPNGMIIYNVNTSSRNGYFKDNEGTTFSQWGTNYFNGGRWQEADNVWYSHNGYEWSYTAGVTENANALWCFNFQAQYPVWVQLANAQTASIATAGVLEENGEEVLYWIECNKGNLFRYIPSINQIDFIFRIYIGDGTKAYGGNQINVIKPVWNEGLMYFHHDGSIKVYDPVAGTVEIFSEDMEIIEWN